MLEKSTRFFSNSFSNYSASANQNMRLKSFARWELMTLTPLTASRFAATHMCILKSYTLFSDTVGSGSEPVLNRIRFPDRDPTGFCNSEPDPDRTGFRKKFNRIRY